MGKGVEYHSYVHDKLYERNKETESVRHENFGHQLWKFFH